ncbi:hypothetical protein ACNHKD_05965 [Methylocystis sp. JAN1]|uniref:hypothetical protein n=1 Tax=Methylocystis sp. JAN1 TaxID=3397211 RepID=UPI003FA2443B
MVESREAIFEAFSEREALKALYAQAIAKADSLYFSQDRAAYEAAQRVQEDACYRLCDYERGLLAVRPQTVAGALALLRFAATFADDGAAAEWNIGDAVRACVELIERKVAL